ncbi:tetratricopeptide repeat protein [Accumulibacter sp.]|uniref:tetratricopeptide repeat protein n=1 Tax=Accumulibacter sp. TaxID=2053492 RepID=UPI0025FC38DD|nr:tetratricopeptide repeat protein [Accumulibacter sp.]MCM8596643.1 tetratricopeptide repeat protein [Accumulibacter sp.]MCM8627070.1 tetratricopeptide repeat protein [Accumulibacter sp.]MDS4050791.1 tetratricopeptide repeat protein [Accumulibacter sp.]
MAKKNILTQGRKAQADRLALNDRTEEARAIYAGVCRSDPTDVEAWVKLSSTQRRLGLYAEAEASSRRALLLAPNQALAHHTLAVALQCQGRLDEAMASYRQAIQLRPEYADSHYLLGNALMRISRDRDRDFTNA